MKNSFIASMRRITTLSLFTDVNHICCFFAICVKYYM